MKCKLVDQSIVVCVDKGKVNQFVSYVLLIVEAGMGKSMLVNKLVFVWTKGDGLLKVSLVYKSSSCKQAIIEDANHGHYWVLLTLRPYSIKAHKKIANPAHVSMSCRFAS